MAKLNTKKDTNEIIDHNIDPSEEGQIDSNLKQEQSSDTTLPMKADAELVTVNPENTGFDEALVNEACEKITSIFSENIERAINETGKYLILEFFDDDYEKAKKKEANSPKDTSLRQVFRCFKEFGAGKPSQSWLYQAIDYVIQEKDLENEIGDGKNEAMLKKFNKLLVSHKVTLLSVKDISKKIEIIKAIEPNDITVEKLKAVIRKKGGKAKRKIGALTIIKNPTAYKEVWEENLNKKALEDLSHDTLTKLPRLIKKKKEAFQKDLENLNANIAKYNELENILPAIISAKKKAKTKQKNGKS